MNFVKQIKDLCSPAQLYLGLSVLSIIVMGFQNCSDPSSYKCGLMKANTPINNIIYFAFKVLYILLWTYLLNILCRKGWSKLSWLLVLFPFIAMFIMIGLTIIALQHN